MRAWLSAPILLLCACSGGKSTGDCTAMAEGPWMLDGTCIGMEMHATVTASSDGCSFTYEDWDMEMTNLPSGGSVSGEEVTMDWDDKTDCVGTTDGTTLTGTCSDGCSFEGQLEG